MLKHITDRKPNLLAKILLKVYVNFCKQLSTVNNNVTSSWWSIIYIYHIWRLGLKYQTRWHLQTNDCRVFLFEKYCICVLALSFSTNKCHFCFDILLYIEMTFTHF